MERLKIFWKTFFCGDRLKNFCEDLFFLLESTCACVFGPWPWLRAFLFLASIVSVLGKAVLGLGLGFFLCPWPWPRALGPQLHLWFEALKSYFNSQEHCPAIICQCFENPTQELYLWFVYGQLKYFNETMLQSEVESSRTDFEVLGLGLEGQVLGLGLEASSPRKLACHRLEDSTSFCIVKMTFFFWRSPEKFL